jgi:hypothetical protein
MSTDGTESQEVDIPEEYWVAMLEQLYFSAYQLHDDLDDVDPGYEYAVQQLCSELRVREPQITKDMELRAMNAAQKRSERSIDRTEDRPLSEYGVALNVD